MKIENLFEDLNENDNIILIGAKAGLGLSTKIFDAFKNIKNVLVIDRLQISHINNNFDYINIYNDLTIDFLNTYVNGKYDVVLLNRINNEKEILEIKDFTKNTNIKFICLTQLNKENELINNYQYDKFYKLDENDNLFLTN